MSWQKQSVAGPIPSGLANIVQEFGTVLSALTPLLSAASAAVEAAQLFFNPTTSPYAAIVTALIVELEAFNNDLFSTGVYYLSVTGDTALNLGIPVKHDVLGIPLLTPKQAIQAAINSLNDVCDTNRPQFSQYAEVAAFGIMATAPSAGQFLALMEGLLAIMTLPDWLNFELKIKRILTPLSCPPVDPQWSSLRLNSIQDLKEVQVAINSALNSVQGYLITGNNILTQLADLISAKQRQLTLLQQQLQNIVNNLRSATGLFVMNLPPTVGGNVAIQTALTDCVLEQSTNQYSIMTLVVGGGPSLLPANLFRLMIL